jgi:hypothetical protein
MSFEDDKEDVSGIDDERRTLPAPDEPSAVELMIELKAALANAGELMVKLERKLTITQLAMYTQEHKTNVHRDRLDGHELRLQRLEGLGDPEPATAAQ